MEEDTTTTTEQETVQADESSQPESPETQAVQSEEESEDTTDQTESDVDLDEWAGKKGIDVENVDKKDLLKMVFNSEKRMHEATNSVKKTQAVQEIVKENNESFGYDETSSLLNELKVTQFYINNPEAVAYDEKMAEIINNAKTDEEKLFYASNLATTYRIAKAEQSAIDSAAAKQAGRKEALAQVAQAEKAAPPNASATTRQGVPSITDADIANMSAAEYMQFKQDHPDFKPFG